MALRTEPGGAERVLLGGVHHAHPELGSVAEVGPDGVGLEADGDHDVVEPVLLEQIDDVLHHRAVGDGHHGLGLVGGERTQAGSLPAGHDHGFHRAASSPPAATVG